VLCSGEGGMLVSSDNAFAETARSIVNCGRVPGASYYEHHRLGTNLRLAGFQAAILLAQFERLPEQIRRRTENALLLKRLLSDLPGIVWQTQPAQVTGNSWYLMIGRVVASGGGRDAFVKRLLESGVPCTPFYPHTLYQNPLYTHEACRVMDCPVAEHRLKDGFWIPHRVLLSEEEATRRMADVIRTAALAA